MAYRNTSTKVNLPRFQFETPPDGKILDRKLQWRAPTREWLTASEWEQISNPSEIVDERSGRVRSGWWGEWHHIKRTMTIGRLFDTPFDDDPFRLYRMIIDQHTYLWDRQALEGRATEVVLERLTEHGFAEYAALLCKKSFGWNDEAAEGQRLLVAYDGEYTEPEFSGIDDRRDFCLLVMAELAVTTFDDLSVSRSAVSANS